MIHDGVRCRESRAYGWRHGNPETDVDLYGNPVKSNYIVIVRAKDCPVVTKDGREYYQPEGVPQAFPIAHGGTYYGYGKCQVVLNGEGRWVRVNRNGKTEAEWLFTYVKTPYYCVRDGRVYVGACYREYNEDAKKHIARQRGKAA